MKTPRKSGWVVEYIEHGDTEVYTFSCRATDQDDANSQCLDAVPHCVIVNSYRD